jgi:hypothetical protein
MKKNKHISNGIIFLIVFFLVFISTRIVFAASFSLLGKNFGGKILTTRAIPIVVTEASGFACTVPGVSITILPIGSPNGVPVNYLIPLYVTSKTRTTPAPNQWILGKYFGQTQITCIQQATGATTTVTLDTISLYGTSRF